jgi:hypothetical protein
LIAHSSPEEFTNESLMWEKILTLQMLRKSLVRSLISSHPSNKRMILTVEDLLELSF